MIKTAVVLAGGRGSRLSPSTDSRPKPLMPIANTPMISYILEQLDYHVDRVYITLHHLSHRLSDFLKNRNFHFEVVPVHEEKPLGTGGALRKLKDRIAEPFFVINGDVVSSLNLKEMERYHYIKNGIATIAVWNVNDPSAYGMINMDNDLRINSFIEKPEFHTDTSFINAGVYLFSERVLKLLPDKEVISLEKDLFPYLIKNEKVYGFKFSGYWIDAGTLDRFLEANRIILEHRSQLSEPDYPRNLNSKYFKPLSLVDGLVVGDGCIIGPYVSIGRNVVLAKNVVIKNSVLLDHVRVSDSVTIADSIISEGRVVAKDVISSIL